MAGDVARLGGEKQWTLGFEHSYKLASSDTPWAHRHRHVHRHMGGDMRAGICILVFEAAHTTITGSPHHITGSPHHYYRQPTPLLHGVYMYTCV